MAIVVDGVQRSAAASKAAVDSSRKDARDSISRGMRGGNVPASLAKPLADAAVSRGELTLAESCPLALGLDDTLDADVLHRPFVIQYTSEKPDTETHYHSEARRMFTTCLEKLAAVAADKIPSMRERVVKGKPCPSAHYHCHVALEADTGFVWNAPGATLFQASQVPPLFQICKHLDLDGRVVSQPLRNQRQFAQAFVNAIGVVLAPPEVAIANQDLHAFVASAHHTQFGEGDAFVLCPGDGRRRHGADELRASYRRPTRRGRQGRAPRCPRRG